MKRPNEMDEVTEGMEPVDVEHDNKCTSCGASSANTHNVQLDSTSPDNYMDLCHSCMYDLSGAYLIDGA